MHDLIRKSWAAAVSDRATLARLFYSKLFAIAPDARGLFNNDMDTQGRKLVATLGFIIDHLDNPDSLMPAAEELAIRHTNYKVLPEHYDALGQALIGTLSDLLGPQFDDETRAAWVTTYQGLSAHMVDTAYRTA